VHDVSSGFRLYRTAAFHDIPITGTNFETLEEILIKGYLEGRRVDEIPFHYAPRREGKSKVHFVEFALCYAKTLYQMWALRSAMRGADYEDRAYDSRIPLQRYWQRARHRVLRLWLGTESGVVLDVGCGSSRSVRDLPCVVGVDVLASKLRYVHRRGAAVVQATAFALPFAEASFDAVVCRQVVERVAAGPQVFAELARVLAPGGRAVVSTLDYGLPIWPWLARLYRLVQPDAVAADHHVSRYTYASLALRLEAAGFTIEDRAYVLDAEVHVLARKGR